MKDIELEDATLDEMMNFMEVIQISGFEPLREGRCLIDINDISCLIEERVLVVKSEEDKEEKFIVIYLKNGKTIYTNFSSLRELEDVVFKAKKKALRSVILT